MCLVQRNIWRGMGAHKILPIHCRTMFSVKFLALSSVFWHFLDYKYQTFTHLRQEGKVSEYSERNCRGLSLDCWDRGLEPQ